ncbi:hypothetical protein ABID65_008800 [Bradyrhizobium sp. S3.9.2]|uniref:hypothetical protein n=1 Tax=unclassified Bradyrhizobium TaxID=2631580 RepID=UPI003394F645
MKVAKITLIAVAGPGRDDEGKTVYKTGGLTMRRLLARPWTEDEEKRLRQMAENWNEDFPYRPQTQTSGRLDLHQNGQAATTARA